MGKECRIHYERFARELIRPTNSCTRRGRAREQVLVWKRGEYQCWRDIVTSGDVSLQGSKLARFKKSSRNNMTEPQ
jgi:hypothetical protein